VALIDELGAGPVGVDTAIFIYFIEEDERYLPTIAPLFNAVDAGKFDLVTSSLTLLEVLIVPYRAGNVELAQRYEAVLTRSRGVRLVDLSRDQLRLAAQLRAATGAATPDALQLSASLATGCSAFVTNDRRLPVVPGLRIVQLGAHSAR
jgi:predicted nucleic acid-binding protein